MTIDELLGTLATPLLLWGGLLALLAMAAALRLTQWGQWHLVRKCLVLSLLTHALFLVEAHGVHMTPWIRPTRDETTAFELEQVVVGTTAGKSTGRGPVDLWDRFSRRIPQQPVPVRLSRPDAADTSAERSRQSVPEPESPVVTPARVTPRPTPAQEPRRRIEPESRRERVEVRAAPAPAVVPRRAVAPAHVPVPDEQRRLSEKRRVVSTPADRIRHVRAQVAMRVPARALPADRMVPRRATVLPDVKKTVVVSPLAPSSPMGRPVVHQPVRTKDAPAMGVPRVRTAVRRTVAPSDRTPQRAQPVAAAKPVRDRAQGPVPGKVRIEPLARPSSPPVLTSRAPARMPRPASPSAPRPTVVDPGARPDPVASPQRLKHLPVRRELPSTRTLAPRRRLPAGLVYRGPSQVLVPRPTFVKSAPAAGRMPVRVRPKPFRPIQEPTTRPVQVRRLPMLGPQIYRRRRPEGRLSVALTHGGSEESEAAVERALAWVAKQQAPDGHWSVNGFARGWDEAKGGAPGLGRHSYAHSAITGLCTLAFLGGGYTHKNGDHRKTVASALRWYQSRAAADGDLSDGARMYSHAIGTFAVCESLAMTGDRRLEPLAHKAVAYLVRSQHKASGGWRYFPQQFGDTSVHGWVVMALRSGLAAGADVPDATLAGARRWLDTVAGGKHGGQFKYQPGDPVSLAMTAEGLASSLFLGVRQPPALEEGGGVLLANLPEWDKANMYYWYYATLASYQIQGPVWTRWNDVLRDMLVRQQRTKGIGAGSWDPVGRYGQDGGRLYSTALCTLCLEVYYRYLPLYREKVTARAK